jgi:hypothetical protein
VIHGLFKEFVMKKLALTIVLLATSTFSFAGGCWVNGKYVQCPKNADTVTQDSGIRR